MALQLSTPRTMTVTTISLLSVTVLPEEGRIVLAYREGTADPRTVDITNAALASVLGVPGASLKRRLYAALETALGVTGTVT